MELCRLVLAVVDAIDAIAARYCQPPETPSPEELLLRCPVCSGGVTENVSHHHGKVTVIASMWPMPGTLVFPTGGD